MKNNDRFKFRVWIKRDEQYIYDAVYAYDGNNYKGEGDNLGHIYCFGEYLDDQEDGLCVVEQCTGLKDKNGKLIYEGDIVAYNLREGFTDEKFNPRYSVRWSDNYMRFDLMREGKIENIYLEPFFNNKLEIVGNIHQRKTQNVKTEYPPNDIRNFILSE